jgi:cbb3-type cytochrome oxidase subunit 3
MKMDDKDKLERVKEQIRSSPPGVKTANSLLLTAAFFVFVHRIYYAYSHQIAMWKGVVAGALLGIIIFQAGFMLFQKKAWLYWAVLLISLAIALFLTIHGLAEIPRFAHGELEDYIAFAFTALFWLLSIGIVCSLLRKQSREYFRTEKSS